uniref:Uncharacterized protein n=1 Tax=Rhizophora mucronata TaxID=61149 RepID=A0A2P2NDE8_RHIMU
MGDQIQVDVERIGRGRLKLNWETLVKKDLEQLVLTLNSVHNKIKYSKMILVATSS